MVVSAALNVVTSGALTVELPRLFQSSVVLRKKENLSCSVLQCGKTNGLVFSLAEFFTIFMETQFSNNLGFICRFGFWRARYLSGDIAGINPSATL